jgi:hypothetical protein
LLLSGKEETTQVWYIYIFFSKEMSLQDNTLSYKEFESMEMHKYLLLSELVGKKKEAGVCFFFKEDVFSLLELT